MKPAHLSVIFFLAIVILTIISRSGFAQLNYRFRHYTSADGLYEPEGVAVQDKLGFVWFSHAMALDRFDGYTFKSYTNNPDDSLRYLGAKPFGIEYPFHFDPEGTMWLYNNLTVGHHGLEVSYLLKYDRNIDGFIRYVPAMGGASIGTMTFNKVGSLIWIGGEPGKGLYSYDPVTGETVNYFNELPDSLARVNANFIRSIEDMTNYLILNTRDGFWRWNKKTKLFSRTANQPSRWPFTYHAKPVNFFDQDEFGNRWGRTRDRKSWIKVDSTFSILQNFDLDDYGYFAGPKKDSFWFSLREKGLCIYDGKNNSFTYARNIPGDPFSCPPIQGDVNPDRDNNVWVGTANGVSYGFKSDLRFYNTTPADALGLPVSESNNLWLSGVDLIGDMLLVTVNGKLWTTTIRMQDSIQFKPFKVDFPKEIGVNLFHTWLGPKFYWMVSGAAGVVGLAVDPNTKTISGKSPKIFSHLPENRNSISENGAFKALWEDPKENLWVGTWQGLDKIDLTKNYGEPGSVTHYLNDPQDSNSISHNVIRDLAGEDDDSFWVATEISVDLFRDGRFEHVFKDRERVSSVFKSSDGTVFIGTEGGLYISEKVNNRYQFTKSKHIRQAIRDSRPFVEDKLGRIWVATIDGIVCLDRKENIAIELNELDGLINRRSGRAIVNWGNISPDGIMVYGFLNNGFSIFDPTSLKINRKKTYPVLTQLMVNNKLPVVGPRPAKKDDYKMPVDITVAREIVLDYLHNNFSIEFSAMEMIVPERNIYQHKLEGYDHDWITSDYKNRTASYTNLDAGHYTFKVKASNYQGFWSDQETTLAVVVLPPPWKTWWAYMLYFITITGSTIYYIKSRERSLKKRQVELEQTVTERTADLVAEKKEVERQRNRSDELLENILPSEVAEELKANGSAAAKHFGNVTVMFTDVKGFTQISEKLTPSELVAEIHACFKVYDEIVDKHKIEKIKTIGDSYMCAGGLPVVNTTNAADVVHAALEIQQFMKQNAEQKRKEGKEPFEIRIGIHSGPVVAGIVGIRKFAYDIWGDTVNVASRMESSSEVGKVNISQHTYDLIKDNPDFKFESRGKIEAKHKGEIEMYFVEQRVEVRENY